MGLRLIGRTAEEGSRTLVHAALADESTHGRYVSECRIKSESRFVRSEAGKAVEWRLWSELIGMLEGIQPGVSGMSD